MSKIDELKLQIEIDGKGAVKEADKVTDSVENLKKESIRSRDSVSTSFKGLGSSISSMVSSVMPKLVALTGAIAGFSAILNLGQQSQSLGQLSDKLGISTERLSAFGQAVEDMGGSKESLFSTLSNLQQSFTQFQQFGEGALRDVSVKYGLAISGDADTQLLNIASRMQGMTRGQQADMASMLGIDDQTLALLRQGRAEVEAMIGAKSDGLISKKDAEAGERLTISLNKIKNAFRSISQVILSAFVPVIETVVVGIKTVIDFFRKFEGLGTAIFLGIGSLIALKFIPILMNVVKTMNLLSLASLKAMLPFIAIGVAIAGIILVVQDLWVWFKGGESIIANVFGGMYEWINKIVPKTGVLRDTFEAISVFLGMIWDGISTTFNAIGGAFSFIGDALGITTPSAQTESIKNNSQVINNNVSVSTDSKAPRAMGKAISSEITKGITGQASSAFGG